MRVTDEFLFGCFLSLPCHGVEEYLIQFHRSLNLTEISRDQGSLVPEISVKMSSRLSPAVLCSWCGRRAKLRRKKGERWRGTWRSPQMHRVSQCVLTGLVSCMTPSVLWILILACCENKVKNGSICMEPHIYFGCEAVKAEGPSWLMLSDWHSEFQSSDTLVNEFSPNLSTIATTTQREHISAGNKKVTRVANQELEQPFGIRSQGGARKFRHSENCPPNRTRRNWRGKQWVASVKGLYQVNRAPFLTLREAPEPQCKRVRIVSTEAAKYAPDNSCVVSVNR